MPSELPKSVCTSALEAGVGHALSKKDFGRMEGMKIQRISSKRNGLKEADIIKFPFLQEG